MNFLLLPTVVRHDRSFTQERETAQFGSPWMLLLLVVLAGVITCAMVVIAQH